MHTLEHRHSHSRAPRFQNWSRTIDSQITGGENHVVEDWGGVHSGHRMADVGRDSCWVSGVSNHFFCTYEGCADCLVVMSS